MKKNVKIDPRQIVRGENVARLYDSQSHNEMVKHLVEDMKDVGNFNPITVIRIDDSDYILMNGYRRFDAAMILLKTIPDFKLLCNVYEIAECKEILLSFKQILPPSKTLSQSDLQEIIENLRAKQISDAKIAALIGMSITRLQVEYPARFWWD